MSLKKDNVNIETYNRNIELKEKKMNFSSLLDKVQKNNLEEYYIKENSNFIKKIDNLNIQFYLETENFINNKSEKDKSQNKLFMILFKQINLYISEIERLNRIIKNYIDNKKKEVLSNDFNKTNLNFLDENNERIPTHENNRDESFTENKFMDEFLMNLKDVNINNLSLEELKSKYKILEKKIIEKTTNEQKLNFQIKKLKRQLNFYNEKLKIEIDINKHKIDDYKKGFYTINNNNHKGEENKIGSLITINNDHKSFKNCDIININNNTYNTIYTNNDSRESSTNKNPDLKLMGLSDCYKNEYQIDLNCDKNNIENINTYSEQSNKMIKYEKEASNQQKSERTLFSSIICNENGNFGINNPSNPNCNSSSININSLIINTNNDILYNDKIGISSTIKNSNSNKNIFSNGNMKSSKIINNINTNSSTNIQANSNNQKKVNNQLTNNNKGEKKENNNISNSKILNKKRNYSDNNPQQMKNQLYANNKYDINLTGNETKTQFTKTMNLNTRYSCIDQKPINNLSPKNIFDGYNKNSNKITATNNNNNNLNSNSFNTSNCNPKNPLSISLNESKFTFLKNNNNENITATNTNMNTNANSKMSSAKDLKIVNAIKQSVSKESKRSKNNLSYSNSSKLYNLDFSNMKISNQQETKNLQELIINNFNYLEDEFQEIYNLENQLKILKENLSIYDYVLKPESLELGKKHTILSDIDDGYKSAHSSISDKNQTLSNYSSVIKNIIVTSHINVKEKNISNKFPILTSVTIDLNKDESVTGKINNNKNTITSGFLTKK